MDHTLELKDVYMHFGGIKAVDGVSFTVDQGEILGIIGPNGSGKSTLINVITSIYAPTKGHVLFHGKDITAVKPHEIANMGIFRTFQNLRIFRAMTVLENVVVAQQTKVKTNSLQAIFDTKKYRDCEKEIWDKARNALSMVGLEKMANEVAGSMAYGQQKRLEIARALVSEPTLCLLDEPAAGMNSKEAMQMMELVQKIRKEHNLAIILIEHNMEAMMTTADRIVVMDAGKKIAEDVPLVIKNDPQVIKVYLGE